MDVKLFEFNKKYGFHDTAITGIHFFDGRLSISFLNGIYLLNGNGKEINLTRECCMTLITDKSLCTAEDNVSICFYKKNRRKLIPFMSFEKMLNKNKFEILFDYYSHFARSILFRGYVGKYSVDFIVENIKAVELDFVE